MERSQRKWIRINPEQSASRQADDLNKNFQIVWQDIIDNKATLDELRSLNNSDRPTIELEQTIDENLADAQIHSLMAGNCMS